MARRSGPKELTGAPVRVDLQPMGQPEQSELPTPAEAVGKGRSNGKISDRSLAAELGRKGGRARAAKARELRALSGIGLLGVTPAVLARYLDAAAEFALAEVKRLARECDNGVCPENAAALIQAGARAMGGSCAAYAAGDLALGAKLGAELRQHLLGARELTVRETQSRRRWGSIEQSERPQRPTRILIHGPEGRMAVHTVPPLVTLMTDVAEHDEWSE
jgi:hypothetical protein